MVRIRSFHCHGLGSVPGQGTDPISHVQGQKTNKQKNTNKKKINKACMESKI